MPASFLYGEKMYGIDKAMIATFNPVTEVYGTPEIVPECNLFKLKPVMDGDTTRAGRKTTSTVNYMLHMEFEFGWAGVSRTVLDLIAPVTLAAETGTTPSKKQTGKFKAGDAFPYFGLAVELVAEGGANKLLGLLKCQLTEPPAYDADDGKFVISSMKGQAVADSSGFPMVFEDNETAVVLDATSFAALMAL